MELCFQVCVQFEILFGKDENINFKLESDKPEGESRAGKRFSFWTILLLDNQLLDQLDNNKDVEKKNAKEITLFCRLLQQFYQNISTYASSELISSKQHLEREQFDLLVQYGISHSTDIFVPGYFYIMQKLLMLEVCEL